MIPSTVEALGLTLIRRDDVGQFPHSWESLTGELKAVITEEKQNEQSIYHHHLSKETGVLAMGTSQTLDEAVLMLNSVQIQ